MIEEFWTEAEAEAGCDIVLLSHHDGFHELTTQQFERLSQFRFLYFSCVRRGCYADAVCQISHEVWKQRKNPPLSWGLSADKSKVKKKVLCVYHGKQTLWKDDLMMHNESEVKMKLPEGS